MSARTFTTDVQPSITKQVVEEYEQVRRTGRCNMTDRQSVLAVAKSLGLLALIGVIDRDNALGTRVYWNLIDNYVLYLQKYDMLATWQPTKGAK